MRLERSAAEAKWCLSNVQRLMMAAALPLAPAFHFEPLALESRPAFIRLFPSNASHPCNETMMEIELLQKCQSILKRVQLLRGSL